MRNITDRFATLDGVGAPDLWREVERRAARLATTEPLSSVTVRGPVRRSGVAGRGLTPLMAAILVAAVAGTVAVGSGLVSLPSPEPSAPPSTLPSAPLPSTSSAPPATSEPSVTPQPSEPVSVGPAPWVVVTVHRGAAAGADRQMQLWAMRADGSDPHEIRSAPDMTVGWSRDGSRLLVNDGRLWVATVGDDFGQFADTGISVPQAAQWEAFDFAPDGDHVVFVQRDKCPRGTAAGGSAIVLAMYTAETAGANCWVLSTIDLRTGKRVELKGTLVKDQTAKENLELQLPAWSPDGTRIAYAVVDQAHGTSALWTVNADGSNASKVDLDSDVPVSGPRWSPDGTRIAFTSLKWLSDSESDSAIVVVELSTGHAERLAIGAGSGPEHACCADWIDDTNLRVQDVGPDNSGRFLSVAIGRTAEPTLFADLRDALATIKPPLQVTMRSAPGDPGRTYYWQPRSH